MPEGAAGANYLRSNRHRAEAGTTVVIRRPIAPKDEDMNLIEIRHPAGALSTDDHVAMATEVTAGLTGEVGDDAVPASTLRRVAAMTHVAFTECSGWRTGNGSWGAPGDVPPLWITVTVPEAWREELARHEMGWLRRAVRRVDADHGWQRPGGLLWINMVGVADGSIGMDGKAVTADDVVAEMSREFRADLESGQTEVPDGMLLDPTCGMLVKDRARAITLEHEGIRYGFCAHSCRDAFVRRHAA